MSDTVKEKTGDRRLRYMERFECIGGECEDNCCHSWRVEVDQSTYKKLRLAARRRAEDRELFEKSLVKHQDGKRTTYAIKLLPNGLCPFLEEDGLCHVHRNFGPDLLSDVCATYPKRVLKYGERRELNGMASCPEVARQLLLRQDAIDWVDWDHKTLFRKSLSGGIDPRDVRPYWRFHGKIREFVFELLGLEDYSIDKRLFFLTYFGNRTVEHFNAHAMKGNVDMVAREMELLRNPKVLNEIGRRLDAVQTPSSMVLLLARELVREQSSRGSFRALVENIFDSYENLMGIIPPALAGGEQRELDLTEAVWEDYQRRRDRVMKLASSRVSQYFHHFAAQYWTNRTHIESPDLLIHMLRMLCEMSVLKFLLFSHPWVMRAFDRLDIRLSQEPGPNPSEDGVAEAVAGLEPSDTAPHGLTDETGDEESQVVEKGSHDYPDKKGDEITSIPAGETDPQETFINTLDRAVVDVLYKTARHIEHSSLLHNLEKALARKNMKSLAGAVYLIRF